MEEHTRRWVLVMLLRSMQKKFKGTAFMNWSISEFLDKTYDEIAYHTIVLAVVPFGKEGDKPCKIMYPTGGSANVSEYIGPFALTCTKSLKELVNAGGDFNGFTRQWYRDIVKASRTKKDVAKDDAKDITETAKESGKDGTSPELKEVGIKRVRTFGVFNTEPYDYVNGELPTSKRDKLYKAIQEFADEARGEAERANREENSKQREYMESRKRKVRAQKINLQRMDMERLLEGKAPIYGTRFAEGIPYQWYPRPALTRYTPRRNGKRARRRYDDLGDDLDEQHGTYDDASYDDTSYDDASYDDASTTRGTPRQDTRALRTERRRQRQNNRYAQRDRQRRDRVAYVAERRRNRSRQRSRSDTNDARRVLRYDASADASDASDPNMDNFSDGVDSSNASTDSSDLSDDDRTVTSSGDDVPSSASSSEDVVGRSDKPERVARVSQRRHVRKTTPKKRKKRAASHKRHKPKKPKKRNKPRGRRR